MPIELNSRPAGLLLPLIEPRQEKGVDDYDGGECDCDRNPIECQERSRREREHAQFE